MRSKKKKMDKGLMRTWIFIGSYENMGRDRKQVFVPIRFVGKHYKIGRITCRVFSYINGMLGFVHCGDYVVNVILLLKICFIRWCFCAPKTNCSFCGNEYEALIFVASLSLIISFNLSSKELRGWGRVNILP